MVIKAVLFDLDNTLIDFMRMKKRSCEAAVHAMVAVGLPLSEKTALALLYKLYDKYGLEYNQIFQEFLKQANKQIDYKILAHGVVAYRKEQTGAMETYPKTVSTLIKLREKGLKLAIVSDAPRLKAWLRLVEMNLDSFFDLVIAFEDTGKLKPRKEPFMKALKELQLRADECLMVGDRPDRDIKGAKKLGIKTAFAKYGAPDLECDYSDFQLASIDSLLEII